MRRRTHRSLVPCLLLAGCAAESSKPEVSADAVEYCALPPSELEFDHSCSACFHAGAAGQGLCRGDISDLEVAEMASLLRYAVSIHDDHLTVGEGCEQVLWPLAEFLVESAATQPLGGLDDLKDRAREPELYGGDVAGLNVRIVAGVSREAYWGGLKDYVLVAMPEVSTCCLGEGCVDAEFRCEAPAGVSLPTSCEVLP